MISIRCLSTSLAAAALAGCASRSASPASVPAEPVHRPVVALTAASAPGFGAEVSAAEYARRDDSLNAQPALNALEQSSWRRTIGPTLERDRQISISTSPSRYTYFQSERRRVRH